MAITQTSDLNSLFPLIYEGALFVAAQTNLMVPLVRNYSATGYMARKISTRPQITAVAKGEGDDFAAPTTFGRTLAATLTPSVGAFAQVLFTDEDVQTDPDSAVVDASRELGTAVARKIDTDLCALFSSFSTDKGTSGSALTIARCAAGLATLSAASVIGPLTFVLHPYGWYDIWTELGQPAATKVLLGDVANQALRDYLRSTDLLGARWFEGRNIAIDATPDAVSGVFVQEAIAFDSREDPNMETERDASRKATEINMSAGYAVGVQRSTYGVALTHDATVPTGT